MSARELHASAGTGPWTRLAILAQVVVVVLLAAAAAALLTWLSARPGLRMRVDLTALGTNTLDPTLADLIAKLPERATIDVFFRPAQAPFTRAAAAAQAQTAELLLVARGQFPDKLRVVFHDLANVADATARMRELGVEEENVVVVSLGKRKSVLKLWRDLARLDPGNPALRSEPTLESFRGEEALGVALLSVSVEDTPHILFTAGHGERDLLDAQAQPGLGRLQSALQADGFRVSAWDSAKQPELPAETRVVALVDPRQPLRAEEFDVLARFVDGGGRLLVVPSSDDAVLGKRQGAEDLLARFGIVTAGGYVAAPFPDRFGTLREGDEKCSVVWIPPEGFDQRHPITESLFRAKRMAVLVKARAFARGGNAPVNGVMPDVVRTPAQTWRDLSSAGNPPDWTWNQELEPDTGPFAVCIAASFVAPAEAVHEGDGERTAAVSKVLALGSAEVLSNGQFDTNRDLALNLFNWLSSRDQRLVVRPRAIDRRELDLGNEHNVAVLLGVSVFGMPSVCMLLGVFLAWRRRK